MSRFSTWRQTQEQKHDLDSDQSPGPSSSLLSTVPKPMQMMNQCPYNAYHVFSQEGTFKHLQKCRGNYKYQKAKAGEELVYFYCKYNSDHEVIAPELLYHEARCPDKDRQFSYLLNIDVLKDRINFAYDLWDYPHDPEEIHHMYKGLHLDKIVGEFGFGTEVPLEQISDPVAFRQKQRKEKQEKAEAKAAAAAAEEAAAKAKEMQIAKDDPAPLGASGASGPVQGGATNPPRRVRKKSFVPPPQPPRGAEGGAPETDESDDEDWGNKRTFPTFNLMENLMNPRRPMFTYPPGLTKAQRKQFVKFNTQWIRNLKDQKEKRERENQTRATEIFEEIDRPDRRFLTSRKHEYP